MSERLSRRDLLKIPFRTQEEAAPDYDKSKLQIEEPIQIGNLNITPVITEHKQVDWDNYGEELLEALEEFPIISPEYFPPEYTENQSNLLVLAAAVLSHSDNKVFDHVADYAKTNKKTIWVVDPSYSEQAINLRMYSGRVGSIAGGIFGTLATVANERANPSIRVDRRLFLTLTGVSIAGGFVIFRSEENSIRNMLVAEKYTQLGSLLPPGSKAAAIYPYGHWYDEGDVKGISTYLKDNQLRKKTLNKYSWMADSPLFSDLFISRHYQVSGDNWISTANLSTKVP